MKNKQSSDSPDKSLISLTRLLVFKQGLKSEIAGNKLFKGKTSYSLIQSQLGFRGSREEVFKQIEEYVEERKNMEMRKK